MKLIVGYDLRAESKDALALGELLADTLDAELVAACAYPYQPVHTRLGDGLYHRFLASEAEHAAARARGLLAGRERASVETLAAHSPARALHDFAGSEGAALIVVGSTHPGAAGRVVPGGVGEQLLHGAPCPVAVAPRDYRLRSKLKLRSILVGYDGSAESADAVTTAAAIARAAGATLAVERMLPLVERPEEHHLLPAYTAYLEALTELARSELDGIVESIGDAVEVTARLVEEPAHDALLRRSGGVDLVVVGSRSYGPLRQVLLGSTSHRLLHRARCPVIVTPRGVEPLVAGTRAEPAGATAPA